MGFERLVCSPREREQLGLYRTRDYLEGCVGVEEAGSGWARPWRVSEAQVRVLGSCMAWHPGYFKRMARTGAGICVHFLTDASSVALAVRPDPLRDATPRDPGMGFSAVVDGDATRGVRLCDLPDGVPGVEGSGPCELVLVALARDGEAPGAGMVPLPGLGREHEVALWLPYARGAAVRELWCDGTYLKRPPARKQLLVLGDSLGQGFAALGFSRSWPALMAQRLNMALLNQSIAGQVFQPDFVRGAPVSLKPDLVVVELGSNYRFEAYPEQRMHAEAAAFMANLEALWPKVPTLVLTPTVHNERLYPTHPKSCIARVPRSLRKIAAGHANQKVVDGMALVGDAELLADSTHPTEAGHLQMAERLCVSAHALQTTESDALAQARSLLGEAPTCAFGIREALRSGAGVAYASPRTVLLECTGSYRALYSTRHDEARAVLGMLCAGSGVRGVLACGTGVIGDAVEVFGQDAVEPVALAAWDGEGKVRVSDQLAGGIRPLVPERGSDALALWNPASPEEEAWVLSCLVRGGALGAFEKDELVGLVLETPVGSIASPRILAGHRKRGWAQALVAAEANELAKRGERPWILLYPYDKLLLKHLQELGFSFSPATEQCVVRHVRQ